MKKKVDDEEDALEEKEEESCEIESCDMTPYREIPALTYTSGALRREEPTAIE